MNTIYSPYTQKEAVDIVSRYNGVSKRQAQEYLDRIEGINYGRYDNDIPELLASMENYLNDQAKKSFYED